MTWDFYVPPLRVKLKGGVLGCVSLPVLALLALLRGRSGKGPLNVRLRFLPSDVCAQSQQALGQPSHKRQDMSKQAEIAHRASATFTYP